MTVEDGTNANAGNPDPQGDAAAAAAATQNDAKAEAAKGPAAEAKVQTPFGELEKDTADWVTKRDLKDATALAKLAREQDKMIGSQAEKLGKAIVKPGKDATAEEIKTYREKMDIGVIPEDYKFEVPKDLPEDLPYDGDRAKAFAALAAEQELTKAQAKAVHDWAIKNGVDDFKGSKEQETQRQLERAKVETEKLVKTYGPVDGETFKASAAFADKALMTLGGQAALDALVEAKLIGNVGGISVVQSAPIFDLLAKAGQTLYKEGDLVRGNPAMADNPFTDATENRTLQMHVINTDRQQALSLIAAAGKKPQDFGLTG